MSEVWSLKSEVVLRKKGQSGPLNIEFFGVIPQPLNRIYWSFLHPTTISDLSLKGHNPHRPCCFRFSKLGCWITQITHPIEPNRTEPNQVNELHHSNLVFVNFLVQLLYSKSGICNWLFILQLAFHSCKHDSKSGICIPFSVCQLWYEDLWYDV